MTNDSPINWCCFPFSTVTRPNEIQQSPAPAPAPSPLAELKTLSEAHCQMLFGQTAAPADCVTSLIEYLEKTNAACGTGVSAEPTLRQLRTDACILARLTLQTLIAHIPLERQADLPPDLYPALARLSVVLEKSADLRQATLPLCLSMMTHLDRLARGLPPPHRAPAPSPALRALLLDKTEVADAPRGPLPFRRVKTLQVGDGQRTHTLALTNTLERGTYGKFRLGLMRSGELLAIKELRVGAYISSHKPAKKTAPSHAENIAREVARLNTLNSRIAPLQQIDYRGKHYLVMEAMSGSVFAASQNLLQLHPTPTEARQTLANSMLLQVAREMDVLHRAGYVHCDIKPHNILLAKDGTIVLADLGSAKARGNISRSGCTHHYMPFEDDGRTPLELRPAFDIFSLGITWLGVLQPEQHRLSWRMDRTDSIDMHRTARGIDPVVANYVFNKMLHPDPDQRPTARETIDFMEALRGPDISPAACEHIARTAMGRTLAQHETIRARLEKSLQGIDQGTTEGPRRSARIEAQRSPRDTDTL